MSNEQEKNYSLDLNGEEVALLATALKNVPLSGSMDQIGAIYPKLNELLKKVEDLLGGTESKT